MRSLSGRITLLLLTISCLAVGLAHAGSVTFPSDNSFYCNTNSCDFVGNNGGQTAPFFTSGDFVTEIFFTGQPYVKGLQFDIFAIDNLGGNPGAKYENDFYVNSTLVGSFFVADCNYCGTKTELAGAFNFAPIQGDGTYALSIVLADTVPLGDGNEIFLAAGKVNLVPEPSTVAVLGSGLLVLVGLMRRKLLR